MIAKSITLLNQLQYPNGLFSASRKDVKTGYHLAWLRDNIYIALGLEATKNIAALKKTYRALLDILIKHEYKIDWMIQEPEPKVHWRYIHARYHPLRKTELKGEWGNKQNDTVGALLFHLGQLEQKGTHIIRHEHDRNVLQKLVRYLASIEYWHDKDSGMWEEKEEVHASSIGACVAGLKAISSIVHVPPELIANGERALRQLLPRESETKDIDLALLSLLYPYNVATAEERSAILRNVEIRLVRKRGVIRYAGDQYCNTGSEAEWTFGFPWLAIIYKQLNRPDKYAHYMRKTMVAMNGHGELPELYHGNSAQHNENTPLGWAQALYIVAATQETEMSA